VDPPGVLPELQQLGRDLHRRQHEVDGAAGNGGARHPVVVRVLGCLGDRHTTLLANAAQADGAVRPGTREDDPHGATAVRIGQGAEEVVDGSGRHSLRLGRRGVQGGSFQHQLVAVRYQVDMIGFEFNRALRLYHRHGRAAGDDAEGGVVVLGRKVQHDDERHPALFRKLLQQPQQRAESAGSRTDANHRKGRQRLAIRIARRVRCGQRLTSL
jgi:hypothetical protein